MNLHAVTFIIPHQRPGSGGVQAIEQFAIAMAPYLRVHVAVLKGDTRPLPGVSVKPLLPIDALPDADVLVLPADLPDVPVLRDAPVRAGQRLVLLQGYGEPQNPVVRRNVEQAGLVVATSRWLTEAASALGARAVHVRYGLDRALWSPGAASSAREPLVALMTHTLDWKGTDVALAAIARARTRCSRLQVVAFGKRRIDSADEFLEPSPAPPEEVASLMRRAAVFVCSSWEEGFGLPGLEAMACGAALATTDTKGSRDYAHHQHTALVSQPGDSAALADSIVALIEDVALRQRLTRTASESVVPHFPTWPIAGTHMLEALSSIMD
jgi:glycosyltransferase involved in cell wall biosynthesis